MKYFPARVFVSSENIRNNATRIKELVNDDVEVMAIVKANAYGHGLLECALRCFESGINWFGVAKISEALKLKKLLKHQEKLSGLDLANLRVFSWIYGPNAPFEEIVDAELVVSVSTLSEIQELAKAAKQLQKQAYIHIKVDTGLGRNGFTLVDASFDQALGLIKKFETEGLIVCDGIWSHLALADQVDNDEAIAKTLQQQASFEHYNELVLNAGLSPTRKHIAASAAILNYPQMHYNMVRPGILLYGVSPNPEITNVQELGFKPAMRLDVQVNNVKLVEKNSGISYGHDYTTTEQTNIAVVPLGYADGIMRSFGGTNTAPGAPIFVEGKVVHVAGRICMDQFMLDLGSTTTVKAGDWITLFGSNVRLNFEDDVLPRVNVGVENWAKVANTIAYEVLTITTSNVTRRWI
ncbi:MAG: alanine racemase [Candidatus Ancillula sp.]|jgi:alanine racemase|nr:alanine racemase [Candidatus Ancillula sp.]